MTEIQQATRTQHKITAITLEYSVPRGCEHKVQITLKTLRKKIFFLSYKLTNIYLNGFGHMEIYLTAQLGTTTDPHPVLKTSN